MNPPADKVRENRLRRMAERQGLTFTRSRRRDPRAVDYGRITLTSGDTVLIETADLDELERWLDDPASRVTPR